MYFQLVIKLILRSKHHQCLSCSVFECEKRNPVVCKYSMSFKRCKFSPCAFKH